MSEKTKPHQAASKTTSVPHVAGWFQNGFHRFLRRYLKRHFHTIAIDRDSRSSLIVDDDQPLIVYGNHPSWWDPLIAHFLNRSLFPNRQFYAPIDADALEQYKVFANLGSTESNWIQVVERPISYAPAKRSWKQAIQRFG